MNISELMARDVNVINPSATMRAARMPDEGIEAFPVGDSDHLTVMVTDCDITVHGLSRDRTSRRGHALHGQVRRRP